MDSNVARAGAVTVLAAGLGVGGSRSCTTRSSSTGRARSSSPPATPNITNSPRNTRRAAQVWRGGRGPAQHARQGQGGLSSLRPLEGRLTLRALTDDNSGITAAFVKGDLVGSLQGRLATEKQKGRHAEYSKLRSVGRLFYEPVWVFTRGDLPIETLRDLKGKRIISARATAARAASPGSC